MLDDPPEPTVEERERCTEMWRRARTEIEAAAKAMKPGKSRYLAAPAPDYTPRVDVSDLPDANASWAEVKAWEERQKEREGQHADGS